MEMVGWRVTKCLMWDAACARVNISASCNDALRLSLMEIEKMIWPR